MFPERGTLRDDLEPGLRLLGFERRAVILFRVLRTEVEVIRVLYGGRELERLFAKE
jgi:plasmid stabilization system protein ParE